MVPDLLIHLRTLFLSLCSHSSIFPADHPNHFPASIMQVLKGKSSVFDIISDGIWTNGPILPKYQIKRKKSNFDFGKAKANDDFRSCCPDLIKPPARNGAAYPALLTLWGPSLVHSTAEPWRNGVVEKFNDHYRQKFLAKVTMTSMSQLRQESLAHEDKHNSTYRYSKLQGQAPLTALARRRWKLVFPDRK
jgi:hypothetical protein